MPLRNCLISLCLAAGFLLSAAKVPAEQFADQERATSRSDVNLAEASQWRHRQIAKLEQKLSDPNADEAQRQEWKARQRWLLRWTPGQMTGLAMLQPDRPQHPQRQTAEPDLNQVLAAATEQSELSPSALSKITEAAQLQQRLRRLDR